MRRRSRGQSMVELAILLPILVTLFLGSWTAADLISDNNAAAQATRAGARLAAELGNGGWKSGAGASGCQTSGIDPCKLDIQIVDQVLPIVSPKLTNAIVTEIDIYQPSGSGNGCTFSSGSCPPNNGAYCCGELIDVYTVSGGVATRSSATYTLDKRGQTHPNEDELGVRLVFQYTSPTMTVFSQTDSQYSVVRLAPVA
jgi:Flp pilus assembly protein TadG